MSKDDPSEKEKKEGDLFNLFDLRIFGIKLGDLLRDIDGTREKILAQREELRKKLGDSVKVDFGVKIGGLMGEQRISSGGIQWGDLAREKTEWRRRLPLVKITKEDLARAKEELEKEKEQLEKMEKELEREEAEGK